MRVGRSSWLVTAGGVIALWAALPASQAWAQTAPSASQLFSISSADAPIQWLENIFLGTSAPDSETFLNCANCTNNNSSGLAQTGLQALLSYYSYAMLVMASVLLLYYLLRAIAESAHTGKPGGRMNQLWGPIRMIVAIGLLVPVPPTNLNTGQMIVITIAKQGSALATNAWNAFGTSFLSNLGSVFANAVPSGQDSILQDLVQNYTCEYYIKQEIAGSGSSGSGVGTSAELITENTMTSGNQTVVSFGNQSNNAEVCGTLTYYTPTATISDPNAAIYQAAVNAQYTALQSAISSAQSFATDFVAAYYPPGTYTQGFAPSSSTIQNAVNSYNQQLLSSASSEASIAAGLIQSAFTQNAFGWLSAGSFFLAISRLQDAILSSTNTAPTVVPPNPDQLMANGKGGIARLANNVVAMSSNESQIEAGITSSPQISMASGTSALYQDVLGVINNVKDVTTLAPTGSTAPSGVMLSGTLAGTTGVSSGNALSNFINDMVGWVTHAVSGSGLLAGQPLKGFPITALQGLGFDCLKAGTAIYAAGAVGGIIPWVGTTVSSLSVLFGSVLFAPGIMLAYILPILPFVRFLFAVFGWVLHYAEAVISVPVFALAHLDPEGEGIMPQQARQGYMLLLQLIFRPLLIVIGLIVAMLLMNGMFDFLNAVWTATVLGAGGTVVVSPTGTSAQVGSFSNIVYGIIYAATAYTICNMCFKAIDYIPNHALRWIGSSGDQHDSSHGPHIEAATLAGAAIGTQMGRSAAGLGTGVAQRRSQINQAAARGAEESYREKLAAYNAPGITAEEKAAMGAPSYRQEFRENKRNIKGMLRTQTPGGKLLNLVTGWDGTGKPRGGGG